MSSDILVIPDTQVRQGVCTEHIAAAGRYAAWHKPDVVVFIGDFADMPALSMYNSRKQAEGLTIQDDFSAAIAAMKLFLKPIKKVKGYNPRLVLTTGNHDPAVRLKRLEEAQPELTGSIDDKFTSFMVSQGLEIVPFLEVVKVEGISFSHYFSNPSSLKGAPIGGAVETMIKNLGHSFVCGHQQRLSIGKRYLSNGDVHMGIVAGAFYSHEESYMNIQSQHHWRGIIHLGNASNGNADISEISLDSLVADYYES